MKNIDILIFDFGSQYTQLIARRIREAGVYCQIVPYYEKLSIIEDRSVKGIIFSGGPSSVYEIDAYKIDKSIYNLGIPILGICYGMQLIVTDFGGEVQRASKHEYGKASLIIKNDNTLLRGIESKTVWMSHSDRVEKLPSGFKALAGSENSPYALITNSNNSIYAMQFHPEVNHTVDGGTILENFTRGICNIKSIWSMDTLLNEQIKNIQEKVKDDKVLCAVSGGVDSSVVASLMHKAIGDNLISIFIDNGLLRKNEKENVEAIFKSLNIPLIVVDASELFLKRLKGITNPESKRKIIGNSFIEVFESEAKKISGIKYLAQGTLYPDIIESISVKGPSKVIKSHHNVGGLPQKMNLKLIEPLRELFKDEVRSLGLKLGISKDILFRHPFPGPGLGVRVMGSINKDDLHILKEADFILIDELKKSGYYDKTWQAFVVLLNVKSVGVMGDNRTYENCVCIRVVDATDAMTATFSKLPFELLERISNKIINEVDGINRVVYDISSKPPATIEWE